MKGSEIPPEFELFGIPRWIAWGGCIILGLFSVAALAKYPGQVVVYLGFTVAANALLIFGFRRGAIFFDTFIGIFLWLGFWLKLTVSLVFMDGKFREAVGGFDGSAAAFDQAMIAASCGFLGLLAASCLRKRWMFSYSDLISPSRHDGLLAFYRDFRKLTLSVFILLVLVVTVSNFWLGVYQRGSIPRTILPFGLSGVYAWLLMFGLSSISATVLHLEYRLKPKGGNLVVSLALLECFLTNVSLLSRGMILNGSALLVGLFCAIKVRDGRQKFLQWGFAIALFAGLFATSVLAVNHMRSAMFAYFELEKTAPAKPKDVTEIELQTEAVGRPEDITGVKLEKISDTRTASEELHIFFTKAVDVNWLLKSTAALFLDRWVGIEGVLAVTGSADRGWDLWNRAWQEKYIKELGFYDANLITSPFIDSDQRKVHHVSLPGIIAFCYYPGSLPFLFGCLLFLGLLGAAFEWLVFKLGGGNLILCSLLSQVVAYRYAHFGYLPGQTYLLFGALLFNVLLIFFGEKILAWWYREKIATL